MIPSIEITRRSPFPGWAVFWLAPPARWPTRWWTAVVRPRRGSPRANPPATIPPQNHHPSRTDGPGV